MPPLERTRTAVAGKVTAFALTGHVNESWPDGVLSEVETPELLLDLSGISRVNSLGVREWMARLQPIAERARVSYVAVSVPIMDQLNMIQGFDCGGELLSFSVRYTCDACDEETEILLDTLLDRDSFDRLEEPLRQCEVCGEIAQLDDDPAVLFEYPRSVATPVPSRDVNAFLRGEHSWLPFPPGSRFRLRKEVEDAATVFRIIGIIDGGFPARSVVRGAEGRIVLDLSEAQGLAHGGTERWNETMAGLRAARCDVAVVGATPPMLRAFADNPVLVAGAELQSVGVPVRVEGGAGFERVPAAKLKSFLRKPPSEVRGDPRQLQDLARRARDAAETSPAAVTGQFVKLDPLSSDTPVRASGRFRLPPRRAETEADKPAGPYEILCRLASGGMADVFLARFHGAAGFRRVAVVKQLMQRYVTDSTLIRMFLDEARLAARLDHPNIVSILDLGKAGDAYFIAMEYLHGRDAQDLLDHVLAQGRQIPVHHAFQIVADVLSALDRAHQPDAAGRHLVHSDVKLRNILVSFEGVTKLADFGVAQLSSGGNTRTELFRGTLSYAAPECLAGKKPRASTDIWGAGVALYTLLTGRTPFEASTSEGLICAILDDEPDPPSAYRPDLDPRCDAIFERALAKDPAKRYQTAAEFEQDLRSMGASTGSESTRRSLAEFLRHIYKVLLEAEREFVNAQAQAGFTEALLVAPPEAVSALFARFAERTEAGTTVALGPEDSGTKG